MLPKPTRGIRLNKSHPLARSLVGYWLFNEGAGNKVFDLSGNGNTGSLIADTHFVPGKFGSALDFDGTGDYVEKSNPSFKDATRGSISLWFRLGNVGDASSEVLLSLSNAGSADDEFTIQWQGGVSDFIRLYMTLNGTAVLRLDTSGTITDSNWHHYAITSDGSTVKAYIDGSIQILTETTGSNTGQWFADATDADTLSMGIVQRNVNLGDFTGQIDHTMFYNRALSASEIALLYQEPFCMFDRASSNLRFQISNFKFLAGTAAGTSGSTAILTVPSWISPRAGSPWHALFNGMTANAFKLGTSLSLGWFWVRVTGCSALYRGQSGGGMGEVDFTNILTVSNLDVSEISPPSYIPHNSGSTYFYVVRRFNNCGYQEYTLAAAVKVSIKSNGELVEPQPNNIYRSKVEQVDSNKIRLTWFYCPLEQKSQPVSFNIYYDDQTGQIDYQNPLFSSGYKGRKFYSFQSPDLSGEAGEHLFAIRAEDAGGIENISLARLKIQLDTLNPDAIDILRAEAV